MTASEVTFDSGPLLSEDSVTFGGEFITIDGHPVYIGKGSKSGGKAAGKTAAGGAPGAAANKPDESPNETEEQRASRMKAASKEYNEKESEKFAGSLSKAQKDAVHDYTFHGDKVVNGHLRGIEYENAGAEESKKYIDSISTLDSAIDSATTPSDMIVYRGVVGNMFAKKKVGSRFRDDGFMSTTDDFSTAKYIARDQPEGALITIELPKGYKGAAPVSTLSKYANEQEILIHRSSEWTIVKNEKSEFGTYRNITLRPAPAKKSAAAHHSADFAKKIAVDHYRFGYSDPREVVWLDDDAEHSFSVDDSDVTFKGDFITVHGHPVYIGDKKGGESGGHAGGAASSEPEETPRQRENRLRTAAEEYGSPESSIEYSRSLTKEQRAAVTD